MTDPVTSKGAERVVSRRAPAAASGTSAYKESGNGAPQVSPRNTATQARKAKQAQAKVQANKDALLVPPRGQEKASRIAAKAAEDLASFGPSKATRRKQAQAANAKRAEQENVELASAPVKVVGDVVPGTQPTLLQLRKLSKQTHGAIRDEATEAAKEAGKAVRDVLRGRKLRNSPHTRFKKLDEQQRALQAVQANATS